MRILITEDDDALLATDGVRDATRSGLAIDHRVRRREIGEAQIEPALERGGVVVAARREDARDRVRQPERVPQRTTMG